MNAPLPRRFRPRRGPSRRRRSGQAIVEMALVMMVLMMVIMGAVDFSMLLTGYIRATNCTREAVRAAVIRTANATSVCTNDNLSPLFDTYSVSITPGDYLTANAGTPVTVTITANYSWRALKPIINAVVPGSPFPDTSTITVRPTMRLEGKKV